MGEDNLAFIKEWTNLQPGGIILKKWRNMIRRKIIKLVLVVNMECNQIAWTNPQWDGNITKNCKNTKVKKIIPKDLEENMECKLIVKIRLPLVTTINPKKIGTNYQKTRPEIPSRNAGNLK